MLAFVLIPLLLDPLWDLLGCLTSPFSGHKVDPSWTMITRLDHVAPRGSWMAKNKCCQPCDVLLKESRLLLALLSICAYSALRMGRANYGFCSAVTSVGTSESVHGLHWPKGSWEDSKPTGTRGRTGSSSRGPSTCDHADRRGDRSDRRRLVDRGGHGT
jgi:hypothetical protein